jgi:hypothetical protein
MLYALSRVLNVTLEKLSAAQAGAGTLTDHCGREQGENRDAATSSRECAVGREIEWPQIQPLHDLLNHAKQMIAESVNVAAENITISITIKY